MQNKAKRWPRTVWKMPGEAYAKQTPELEHVRTTREQGARCARFFAFALQVFACWYSCKRFPLRFLHVPGPSLYRRLPEEGLAEGGLVI